MKTKKGKRIGAIVMAVLMIAGIMPTDWAAKKISAATKTNTYVLDAADLETKAAGAFGDGDEVKAGTDNFFTIINSKKTKYDTSSKSFDDGYEGTKRINFGEGTTIDKDSIKFTTEGTAKVKVWWVEGGEDNRQLTILKADGTTAQVTSGTYTKNSMYITEFELAEAGTYYLGSTPKCNYIFKVKVDDEVAVTPTYVEKVTTLDAADLETKAAGAFGDGDEVKAGTDNFFTIINSKKTKYDTSSKSFDDGYEGTKRINFGEGTTIDKDSIKFTTEGTAKVKVWWVEGGEDNRQLTILKADGTTAQVTSGTYTKNSMYITEFELAEAGTYYLGSTPKCNYIFKVQVTQTVESDGGNVKPERAAWDTVAAPVITSVTDNNDGTVKVSYDCVVGYDGADRVEVTMNGTEVKKSSKEGTSGSVTFTPASTGEYSFTIKAVRENETDKAGNSMNGNFVLPLATPSVTSATSAGNGAVDITIGTVKEATSYNVYVNGSFAGSTTESSYRITGLTVGERCSITVEAVRSNPATVSSKSAATEVTVTADAKMVWSKATYGSSVDTKNNGVSGSVNDGSVTIYSESGKGKLVPASKDGLTFNYVTVPADKSFAISGKIHVDKWTLSNGQEGFGLMVSDRVGQDGDGSDFWTNSVQAVASKVEYYYDGTSVTTDNTQAKISMKLGVGVYARTGITAQDLSDLTNGKIQAPASAKDKTKFFQRTLETSKAAEGAGVYNIIGNGTKGETGITDMYFSMEEIKTDGEIGYIVTYMDENKNVIGQDTVMGDMTLLDKDNKYVGFFAARNARITVTDVNFELRDSVKEVVVEDRVVVPNYNVTSAANANSENYVLTYKSDVNGTVTITAADGTVVADNVAVEAYKTYKFNTTLKMGANKFTVVSTPEAGYRPSKHEVLSSYDTVSQEFTVTLNGFDGTVIYVGPNGSSGATGSKENPVDIYSAVKFAKAGQKILLLEGTYKLESTVKVARGIDGTADNMIYMIADPDATERPVLDFGKNCEGMVLGGNYWYFAGFDVTNSADAKDGARLCGNYNVVDNCNFYNNGNTGLQISAYNNSNDAREDWPSYNLVLNCSSFSNADKGYEDADGFAAKLTVGDGNVFDGCISYNNADDGWDLFAKTQTGNIGSVTIKNCVAYGNGYLADGTDAGNGNGFKMGGDSLTGYHKLINCVAFNNKAKGIDSNSCPDIQIENCISFNNESYNVALYTNSAVNTDFSAKGIISFRTNNTDINEQFKFKGTQDATKVYNATNYFWNCTEKGTNNANGTVTADWFKSFDTTYNPETHVFAQRVVTRNADGTINMNGLLTLTDAKIAELGFAAGIGEGKASIKSGEVLSDEDVVTTGLVIKTKTAEVAADETNIAEVAADETKTGDASNMLIYIILMAAALGFAGFGYAQKRKNVF